MTFLEGIDYKSLDSHWLNRNFDTCSRNRKTLYKPRSGFVASDLLNISANNESLNLASFKVILNKMLLPLVLEESCWAPRIRRQTDDILKPLALVDTLLKTSEILNELTHNNALNHKTTPNQVDKNKFQKNFDVQHFKPEEITVKIVGDLVTIEGKHEEQQDEHGQVFRHFIRKYKLPKNCDADRLESRLSSDGVLTISAPLLGDKNKERSIPIAQTGKPARALDEGDKDVENPPKKKRTK